MFMNEFRIFKRLFCFEFTFKFYYDVIHLNVINKSCNYIIVDIGYHHYRSACVETEF